MSKEQLVYDPITRSFRSATETRSMSLDSPSEEQTPASAVESVHEPDAPDPYESEEVSRENQYDPETGELLRVKVRKRVESVKVEGQNRQVQFALWIFIGLALTFWIGLIAVNFMGGGHKVGEATTEGSEESLFK